MVSGSEVVVRSTLSVSSIRLVDDCVSSMLSVLSGVSLTVVGSSTLTVVVVVVVGMVIVVGGWVLGLGVTVGAGYFRVVVWEKGKRSFSKGSVVISVG